MDSNLLLFNKEKASLTRDFFVMAYPEEPLSKNNRCSGCFCLQGLWNILLSKKALAFEAKLDT